MPADDRAPRFPLIAVTLLMFLLAPACDHKSDSSSANKSQSAAAAAKTGDTATHSAVAPPKPVDADDDALAPGCLPRSGAAGDWTKIQPIRIFAPSTLATVVPPETAARFAMFPIKSAARCTYARPYGTRLSVADVLLIETPRPDDAYGLMSIQSSAPETESGGCRIRMDKAGGAAATDGGAPGLHAHAWQGDYYLHVWSNDFDDDSAAAIRRLVQNTASRIQREDLPALLEALPAQAALSGHRWLVRRLTALRPDALGLSPAPDWPRVNDVLGLGSETLVAIGQYDAPDARRPDTVWLISYPSIEAARDAYARFSRYLEENASAAMQSASVMEPRGRFLVGTWTAEEESLLYVLPRILQLLPS